MREHDEWEADRGWVARLGGDFTTRLLSGLAMAAVVTLFTLAGPTPFALLVVAVSLLVGWEWARLVNGPDAGGMLIATHVASVGVAGLVATFLSEGLGLLALSIGAILATLLSLGRNSLFSALGVFYAGLPAVALIWLRSDPSEPSLGLLAVIFLIVIVVTADTAAFLCGRLVGGPLLWPRVSPKKTWAGLLGALAACAVVGALFWPLVPDGSVVRLAAVGAALGLVAQGGDLAESALKRRFGAKDAGSILPGHGGFMDRVDGLVAAASAVGLFAAAINVQAPARALLLGS
jgi:phosphatidate cytidylyltransferase